MSSFSLEMTMKRMEEIGVNGCEDFTGITERRFMLICYLVGEKISITTFPLHKLFV